MSLIDDIFGGGGTPPPPDIAGNQLANTNAARETTRLNNPNIINQFGTSTYTEGNQFDQTSYDQAMASYNAGLAQYNDAKSKTEGFGVSMPPPPPPPDRNQFMSGGQATVTQTLSPEQQALYNSNTAGQQSSADIYGRGLNSMSGTLGQQFDLSGAPSNPTAYNPNSQLQANNAPQALDQSKLSTYNPNNPVQAFNAPQALDQSQLPAMPGSGEQTRQNVINAMMSRSNTAIDQSQEQMNSDLIAKGIRPGTEAYTREQDSFNRQRNDARQQAEIAGGNAATQQYGMDMQGRQQGAGEQAQQFGQQLTGQGQNFNQQLASVNQAGDAQSQQFGQQLTGQGQSYNQQLQGQNQNFNQQLNALQQSQGEQAQQYGQQADLRKQNIAELLTQRQQPLNELNALRTGAQTSNPFAGQGFQGGSSVPSTAGMLDQYNTNVYNQQQGQRNANIGAVATLGAAAISDRRLKTDIKKIGILTNGLNIYSWKYVDIAPKGLEKLAQWGKYSTGVMADEVKKLIPKAVININGYDAVDYSLIGV